MRRVDLHPEELLRGEREGEPPAAGDQARWNEHAAGCDACAFEQVVVRDFAEALHREEDGERRVMAKEIAGALADPRLHGRSLRRTGRRPAAGRMIRGLLVAAIICGSSLAAAAGAWIAVTLIRQAEPAEPPPPAPDAAVPRRAVEPPVCESPEAPPPPPQPRKHRGARRPPAVPEPPPAIPEPPPAVVPSDPPDGPATRPPPPAPFEANGAAAEALLIRANAARRVGDFQAAARAYDELGRRFPGTREEVVSRATFGTLLLETLGQPQRALGLFESYLADAPDGALAEEALVGRAAALGRLGRTSQERAAWEQFLARFPESGHAARAQARLAELP